ncbi:MAG: hypothetical protein ACOC1K_03150 [Nanoarchaeota archaeon]
MKEILTQKDRDNLFDDICRYMQFDVVSSNGDLKAVFYTDVECDSDEYEYRYFKIVRRG